MQKDIIVLNVTSAYNNLVNTSKSLAHVTQAAQDMKSVFNI